MKKLMIAAAVILAAVASQASSLKWGCANIYLSGQTENKAAGTMYLYDAKTITQQAVLDVFTAKDTVNTLAGLSVGTGTVAAGNTSNNVINPFGTASAPASIFGALLVGDELFITTVKSVTMNADDTKTTNAAIGSMQDASQAAVIKVAKGDSFSTAGWYQTVPEPTSALLMLLGMAGLALKRKQA